MTALMSSLERRQKKRASLQCSPRTLLLLLFLQLEVVAEVYSRWSERAHIHLNILHMHNSICLKAVGTYRHFSHPHGRDRENKLMQKCVMEDVEEDDDDDDDGEEEDMQIKSSNKMKQKNKTHEQSHYLL